VGSHKYWAGLICSLTVCVPCTYAEDAHDSPTSTNQEVLKNWQDTSGQSGAITDKNGGTIEWHGQATEDVYNVDTDSDQPNNALSGLRDGTFSLTRLQGDLRDIEQAGDINYIQGGATLSNDRAVQSLYREQITNLQLGRAGAGYQIAAGDIVADFSKIGSNLGLRGIYGTKQVNALTLYGYAGTVAESWESLFDRSTLTDQPARSHYLRDALGFKADYKLNDRWSLFGTAQTYSDRKSSLSGLQQVALIKQNGSTGTAGIAYKDGQATFSTELGTSHIGYDASGIAGSGDIALLIDASYAWQTVSVHAGHHNIGIHYTSLAQNVLPGVRETFIGGDWYISPSLMYGNDIRRSDTRTTNLFGDASPINVVYSLTNRLTYNVTQVPGLNFSLQDMRNWGEIEQNRGRNATTQFGTAYANQHYSGNVLLSNSRQRTNINPLSDSVTDGIQLTLGRQVLEGEVLAMPSISGGIQLNGGYQQQRIANGTKTSSGNQGISLSARSQKLGQIQFGFINVDTTQPNGRPTLNTKTVNLDWSKVVTQALALKAYIRDSFRNHGDSIQKIDEKIVGVQADYQW